jgi:hypothetical protein
LSPTSSTGHGTFALTPPNPHAIVLDDTRPPETQRLSLCKGKAEREPEVPGGLVSCDQGKRSIPAAPTAVQRPASLLLSRQPEASTTATASASRVSSAWMMRASIAVVVCR